MFGYDLARRHGTGLLGARFYGHADVPRIREARVTGAIWVVTTNPLRSAEGRADTLFENLARLEATLASSPDGVALVHDVGEYAEAKEAGKHAAFIGIQGGNALDAPGALARLPDRAVVRVTLVHLSSSSLGVTSAPKLRRRDEGLTKAGKDYVKQLDAKRIFVDLAHINRRGFFDAVARRRQNRSRSSSPTRACPACTSTGETSTTRSSARSPDTGGTVGVMYHSPFLGEGDEGLRRAASSITSRTS